MPSGLHHHCEPSPGGASDMRKVRFDRLLESCRDRILLYLASIVEDSHDAEDICQKTCLILWRKFDEYDPDRSFLAWACGIARYEALNARRAAGADRLTFKSDVMHLLAESLDELDEHGREDRLTALRQCIRGLRSGDQALIHQVYWEGRSCEDMASELGCALRTFYNRMSLLRRKLFRCVARRMRLQDPARGQIMSDRIRTNNRTDQ